MNNCCMRAREGELWGPGENLRKSGRHNYAI